VIVPDLSTRINETTKLIEEVEAKLAAQVESVQTANQREAGYLEHEVQSMSNEELALLVVQLEQLETPARKRLSELTEQLDEPEIEALVNRLEAERQ
jgi:hypothetical protein